MEKPVAGNVLAGETLDQPVIPSAAGDRAETHGLALFVGDREGQLGLVNRTGIVNSRPRTTEVSMRMRIGSRIRQRPPAFAISSNSFSAWTIEGCFF